MVPYIKYHLPVRSLRLTLGMSERELSARASSSRMTLRRMEKGTGNPTFDSVRTIAEQLDCELFVALFRRGPFVSDYSTVAVSQKLLQEGGDTWKPHFMELVDEFRKTRDIRLLLLPPVEGLDLKFKALLASITLSLCEEARQTPPGWALKRYFLIKPWFVAGVESLKALCIRDTPIAFRRNNIFVLDNFLSRAYGSIHKFCDK